MAFRKKATAQAQFDTPEALLRDRKNRTVAGVLSHQADILREYQKTAFDDANVAIELPTGSGKTLIGLLIGEFRRINRRERVLYLCPTKQLVQQVVEQAARKYDLKVTPFVGRIGDYEPAAKARYQSGETIAVAPYSALFNTNPYFTNSQLIILDDAHAAENYVASNWTVAISRADHRTMYLGLLEIVSDCLDATTCERFRTDEYDPARWVEMVPSPRLTESSKQITALLDEHTKGTQPQYPWSLIKGHLDACNMYVSQNGIILRPYIPPTMTHKPFAKATQRVFMSATLGGGGDLERITGVRKLTRIPIPEGWDKQGIGRRLFMFPEMSLKQEDVEPLLLGMINEAGRALVLVPSGQAANAYEELVKNQEGLTLFTADGIESSKDPFVKTDRAVAVLANRYDGIDLSGDECRLLIIEGLPKAGNLQETFLLARMAAANLLNDRIRTRIVQAVGRCTRSDTDFAAVCVLGDDFHDWLVAREKRELFHPELQGELQFGVEQSKDRQVQEFVENLTIFLKHGEDWEEADADIKKHRDESEQRELPGEEVLASAAGLEVDYQEALWNQNYERALTLAQDVASRLTGDAVQGLRGFWYLLAASAARLAHVTTGDETYAKKAGEMYRRASACVPAVSWLRQLARESGEAMAGEAALPTDDEALLASNVEQMEAVFEAGGFASPRRFEKEAKAISDGLASKEKKHFEEAHRRLGELLGFETGNEESDAAPDPWWISGSILCLVAEDKQDSKPENSVSVRHTRQAASHPKWIRDFVKLKDNARVVAVMITPATTIHATVPTFADEVRWWQIDDFRKWAMNALTVLRKAQSTYSGAGNPAWRASVSQLLRGANLDPVSVVEHASRTRLAELPVSAKAGQDEDGT